MARSSRLIQRWRVVVIVETLNRALPFPERMNSSDSNDVLLESLNPYDTILLRTHNDYRLLLLDPKTGRALVEGGEYRSNRMKHC